MSNFYQYSKDLLKGLKSRTIRVRTGLRNGATKDVDYEPGIVYKGWYIDDGSAAEISRIFQLGRLGITIDRTLYHAYRDPENPTIPDMTGYSFKEVTNWIDNQPERR